MWRMVIRSGAERWGEASKSFAEIESDANDGTDWVSHK
jgi:hypothetical protein